MHPHFDRAVALFREAIQLAEQLDAEEYTDLHPLTAKAHRLRLNEVVEELLVLVPELKETPVFSIDGGTHYELKKSAKWWSLCPVVVIQVEK